MADKRFDPVTGYEIKALPEGSLNAGQEYLVKPGGGFDSLYYSNSADTSQPSGASIKPMNIIDDYDSATNTYNYGHLTGMTIEQYEDAYKAQKNGTLDSFDPNASGSADVSSTTSGEYTNATGGSADNSGIMSGTASSQPAQIVQQIDTSGLAQAGAMSSGFSGIEGLLSQYNTASANQMNALNKTTSDGFAQVGNRFDTVDSANSNVQNSVDAGFRAAQAARENNLALTGEAFALTGEALSDGFAGASQQLTDTQQNVLGGQGKMQDNLNDMASAADIYAQQSLENQTALQEGQDGFVSSFDTYTNRYGEDQRLASQARNDLLRAQTNQTDSLRSEIVDYAQAAATGQNEISQQVQGLEKSSVNPSGTEVQVANLDQQFAEGLAALDPSQITQARDMAKIASEKTELSMGMRQNFGQFAAAFDDSGKLIQNSIDQQGNTTLRSVDEMGNLLLQSYDTFGTNIGNNTINLRESLQQLSDLQQGANGQMGNLSPAAPAVASGGFASPYTMTG